MNHEHLVVPIEWDSTSGVWVLYPNATATSMTVYDTRFPLRMGPSASSTSCADFDSFVEKVFEPSLVEAVEIQPDLAKLHPGPTSVGFVQIDVGESTQQKYKCRFRGAK